MKTRFNTFDIVCAIAELQRYVGLRVNNIYDINNKTYLIRLQDSKEKVVILLESGTRIHSTNFEWPKNVAPSGFTMKLRKHLKNKRLESLTQVGSDRIVDLQFGTGEAAYHVILELYDKGNIIITDYTLTILNVLRPHTEGEKVKFVVREKYPQDRARVKFKYEEDEIREILGAAKNGDQLKKVLINKLVYGPTVIEHVLLKKGFTNSTKLGKTFNIEKDITNLMEALNDAMSIFEAGKSGNSKGYIIQKRETRPDPEPDFYSNQEFHPFLFEQHKDAYHKEFDKFNEAVDEFFSSMESQKLELKVVQQERDAMKKLENVKKDHSQRLQALEEVQNVDKQKADLIMRNQQMVDKAILAVQTILAKQVSWDVVNDVINELSLTGNEIMSQIKKLKLETNHITLQLTNPYSDDEDDDDQLPTMLVDIDLSLTAFANARKYYDMKRSAARKQQKTIESQFKAFKSAEKKTKAALKDIQTITNINKLRKTYWFEKFYWFISSENYLIIGGRDQQQNELIVKRYMKSKDVYVHADVHGASSIVIKNPTGDMVPPKTLNEAGTMAICYSVAWEAKVVTNAYWVWGEQVTKTAPTGEYLSTGSFMIRGKKNFLPPSHLIFGLGFLFRLEEGSVENHKGERKTVPIDDKVDSKDEEVEEEIEIAEESESEDESKEDVKANDGDDGRMDENDEEEGRIDEDDGEDGVELKFPDTQIKVEHFSGTKVSITTKSTLKNEESFEKVVFLGDDKPVNVRPASSARSRGNSESKVKKIQEFKEEVKEDSKKDQHQMKRGQKSKLKKIKEKYKDQDEEERKLRMEILQSSGNPKVSKKNKKNKEESGGRNKGKNIQKMPKIQLNPKDNIEEGLDDDDVQIQADVDMIDALTGMPSLEDELLFAIPVLAPYNTLTNYKFKVKLTPGTGKKGKAARTAVAMFLKDKTITPREKDLLKAVKDDQLARNLPGKVKLSAPKMLIGKK